MFELMTMALKVEKIVIILALCKGRFVPYRDADTPFIFSLSLTFKFRSPTTGYNYSFKWHPLRSGNYPSAPKVRNLSVLFAQGWISIWIQG